MIGLRTREGLAQRKAEGKHMGRSVDATFLPTYRRIVATSGDGMTMNAIARALDTEGVATARGGQWYASTVRAVLTSETAKAL